MEVAAIDVRAPMPLLAGMSPAAFMRAHWQVKPLLVRGAWPGVSPPVTRSALFALAARDDVESRLVRREGRRWTLAHGPLRRRSMPPLATPNWTLLVQGLEQHDSAAAAMLARFRFISEARLDDLMMSWASTGGGVGPHVDGYDVFLLQVQGRRRWRIAPPSDARFRPGLPLRILARFAPTEEWLLETGDMLYLPPFWGHEGVAVGGACMTCSIGFRAPSAGELRRELFARLADMPRGDDDKRYADAKAPATARPGEIPEPLARFAAGALAAGRGERARLEVALGEYLSEPKREVWFAAGTAASANTFGRGGVRLDRRTRLLYDKQHLFANGEAFRSDAGSADGALLRRLADRRALDGAQYRALGSGARALVREWVRAGWLHARAHAEARAELSMEPHAENSDD